MEKTEMSEEQKNMNAKIKAFVGKDVALTTKVRDFIKKLEKEVPEYSKEYDLVYRLIEMLAKIDGDVILGKLKKYSKEVTNKKAVENLLFRSLNMYIGSLGNSYNVLCLGKQPLKATVKVVDGVKKNKVFGGFTFFIEENERIGFFGVYDERLWEKLKQIEIGKVYSINLTEVGDNMYISKEPLPTLKEGIHYETDKIINAITSTYNEITPETYDIALEEKNGYIKAFAFDVSLVGGGNYTRIIPMFETESLMEDIPSESVAILFGGVANIETDDMFIAFGNFNRGKDKDGNEQGYTMFASAVIPLTEKEPMAEEEEENFTPSPDEEDGFDMNQTGEDEDD